MQKEKKIEGALGRLAFDAAGGFSSEKSTPKVDPVVERINQSDLPKNLKDALLDYFHSPIAENFAALQNKIGLLKALTSKLISLKRYADWFQSLKKLSLIYGVIDYKGRPEQKALLNSVELIKGVLLDLKSQSEKIAASDIQIIAQYWDQWFFSFLPTYLRANSYYSDRPESLCGLLSSYLLNSIIDQPSEFHEKYQALKAVSIDLLQWKGKRVHLKAWLDPLFGMENEPEKNKQAWIEHRAVQEVGWSAVLTDNELAVLFAKDQALCHKIMVIQSIEAQLDRIKAADYLKWPEEKDIHAIVQGMEAIADILVSEANPESRRRWCDDITHSMMFYCGILETLNNQMWAMEVSMREAIQERVLKKIIAAENKLCHGVGVIQNPSPEKQKQSQKKLADYRAKAKKRLEKLLSQKVNKDSEWLERAHNFQQFSDDVTQWVNGFLQELISSAIEALGPVPCSYTFVGLGSLEKHSTTTYSDIEFAILISDNGEACKDYFRKLTYLLHAQVIQLGETPIPYSLFHYNFDTFTNAGFCFDLGGKISLGRYGEEEMRDQRYGQRKYELINTPEEMIRYIEDEWFEVDKLLPVELLSCSYIAGDESLTKRYHGLLEKRYRQCDDSGRKFCERRALTLLKGNRFLRGDLDQFGRELDSEQEGMLVDVKKEVYRLPDRLIGDLALALGIIGGSIANKIDLLQQRGLLSNEQSKELIIIDGIAKQIRLQTYYYYGGQKEKLTVMPKIFEKQVHYRLDDTRILRRFYECAYPITEIMKTFCEHLENRDKKNESHQECFKDKVIRSQDSGILARIAGRLGDVKSKIKHLEKRLNSRDLKVDFLGMSDVLFDLGSAYNDLGDHKMALEPLKRAVDVFQRHYGQNHVDLAKRLNSVGVAYRGLGNPKMALEWLNRALGIFERCYGSKHVFLGRVLNNLGGAYSGLENWKEAVDYHKRALEIFEGYYGPNHLRVAISMGNLGAAYGGLGQFKNSIEFLQRALAIKVLHYGREHPEVGKTLVNLGAMYNELCDSEKAVEYLEPALAIFKARYGSKDLLVARALVNLGAVYIKLRDPEKAVEYLEPALAIFKGYYGNLEHVEVATTLSNLRIAKANIESRKIEEFKMRALAMFRFNPNHPNPQEIEAMVGAHQKDRAPVNSENPSNDSTDKSEGKCASVAGLLAAHSVITSAQRVNNEQEKTQTEDDQMSVNPGEKLRFE